MNHEISNHPNPEPKHRAEEKLRDDSPPTWDAFVASAAEHAPDAASTNRIADAYTRHGFPFAIYLALGGTNLASPSLENDFKNVFVGYYWSRDALIDDTIASFDWGADLHNRLAGDPLLRSLVTFDREAVWTFANDHYEIVDLDGSLYVYEPEP